MRKELGWRCWIVIGIVSFSSFGCATIEQQTLRSTLKVETTPPNAWVWTKNEEGKQMVGRAPTDVQLQTSVKTYRHRRWLTWGSFAVGTALAIVGGALLASKDNSDSYSVDTTPVIVLTSGATLGLYGLIWGLMGEANDGKPVGKVPPVQVGASLAGYEDAWATLPLPTDKKALALRLTPGGKTAATPIVEAKPARARPIVAVFDIEDHSRALKGEVANQLTEYLATQVAAVAELRVIPRSQLRKRLSQQKQRSYKSCYDQACQIELGRALAAHHSLATKILRVGDTCAITSVLYDLKTETSVSAASADTDCSVNSLMAGVRTIASKLAQKRTGS